MILIDLVTLPPIAENDGRRPKPEIRHRIIMTPEAFLRSVAAQQRLIMKLQDAGVVKRLPERSAAESSSDPAAAADAVVRMPRSPNFHGE